MTTKKNLESVDTLQREVEEKLQRIREMKRADSEVNLQTVVSYMNTERENPKAIMKACYDYIAQHRALHKKSEYGNHLE